MSTVGNYISGVRRLFTLLELDLPPSNSIEVQLALKGLKRTNCIVPKRATPLTPLILLDVFKVINLKDKLHVAVWCALLFGFFAMFRISQMCPKNSSQVSKVLHHKDIVVTSRCCYITLKWSKTIQCRQREVTIPLLALSDSPLCPVTAYKLLCAASVFSQSMPVFQNDSANVLLYKEFTTIFKHLIALTGRDPSGFTTHSMRRGGATWAFKCGVPEHLIQVQGDWASDAYKKYLDISLDQKMSVFKLMSSSL